MTKAHAEDHGAAHVAFKLAFEELEGVDELSTRVFRAFMNALRLHRQLMLAALTELDTHPGQAICLRFLSANDGITQRDLADALHLAGAVVCDAFLTFDRRLANAAARLGAGTVRAP